MDSKHKKRRNRRIDWDNMKVTYVYADPKNPNPRNPYAHMSPKQREKEIIKLAAKIWRRHCAEQVNKNSEVDKDKSIYNY
ncbi:MAG: hypothetical protein KAJ18_05710 [Candidatus Omnitrophica bacterium]|nr:hypothetical protein [Candidatus Omnitrophota bacterium]